MRIFLYISLVLFLYLFFISSSASALTIREKLPLSELRVYPKIIKDSMNLCDVKRFEISFYIPPEYPPEVEKVCIGNVSIKYVRTEERFIENVEFEVNGYKVDTPSYKEKKISLYNIYNCWGGHGGSALEFYYYNREYGKLCFDKNLLKSGENKLSIVIIAWYVGKKGKYFCHPCASKSGSDEPSPLEASPLEITPQSFTIFMYKPKLSARINVSSTRVGVNGYLDLKIIVENLRNITVLSPTISIHVPYQFEIIGGNDYWESEKIAPKEKVEILLKLKAREKGNYTLGESVIKWKDIAKNSYELRLEGVDVEVLPPKLKVLVVPRERVGETKTFLIYVKDFYSSEPLSGMKVEIHGEGISKTMYTDIDGKVVFSTHLKSGKLEVVVSGENYPSEIITFDVKSTSILESGKEEKMNIPWIPIGIGVIIIVGGILLFFFKKRTGEAKERYQIPSS